MTTISCDAGKFNVCEQQIWKKLDDNNCRLDWNFVLSFCYSG